MSRRRRAGALLSSGALLAALLGSASLPASAEAAAPRTGAAAEATPTTSAVAATLADPGDSGVPVTSDGITITPFYCSPGSPTQTFTVPADAHSIYVEAVGGEGQTPDPGTTGIGGLAGQVTGVLSVLPGDTFDVQVGCAGDSDGGDSAFAKGGAKGTGWSNLNDFATVYSFGWDGGGGGGASAVLDNQKSGEVVAVAGGGGGAGGDAPNCLESSAKEGSLFFFYCGPGFSTQSGGDGGIGGGDDGTYGDAGANNPAGPTPDGDNCSGPDAGGKGGDFHTTGGGGAGGGGGGGYAGEGEGGGGCGGAAGAEAQISSPSDKTVQGSAGAGGGGGASYTGTLDQASITAAEDSGDGYVLFLTAADGIQTRSFAFSGDYEAYCVPDGVNELFVDMLGGAGGGGGGDFPDRTGNGGGGSGLKAVVAVTERTQLQIAVGQYGHADGGWGDGHGGSHGTSGTEGDGAGGGGSSAVKQSTEECSDGTKPSDLAGLSYLAVAGGGGGGGGHGTTADGGDGGNAGSPGSDGSTGGDPNGGGAGCGGVPQGEDGCETGLRGGDATGSTDGGGGGGGGGGYDGGGKGHGVQDGELGGGGGGGGGNSFIDGVPGQPVAFSTGPRGDRGNRDRVNEGHVDLIVPVPATRSHVSIISGNQQSATPGTAFARPLVIEYVDAITGPTAGTRVTLTIAQVDGRLPAVFTGASGDGSSIEVTTDANGRAAASLTTTTGSPVGQFQVVAQVTDDPGRQIKTSEFTLFDEAVPTTLTLGSDATAFGPGGAASTGQPVTFSATTVATASTHPVAAGAVQFSIDGVDLGAPVSVDATGSALSPAWSATAGQHHVLATYLDVVGGQNATTFSNYSLRVDDPTTSTTSLSSSMPDGLYGDESVSFSFAVTATGGGLWTASGPVQLYRGTSPLGDPIALEADGTAISPAFPATDFGLGVNQITAVYAGDVHVGGSTSDPVALLVIDFAPRPGDGPGGAGTDPGGAGAPSAGSGAGSGSGSSSGRGLAATGWSPAGLPVAVLVLAAGVALITLRRRRTLKRP